MIDVAVTDAGGLQVTVDGTSWAPLPVAAVEALAARLPDARAAASRQGLTAGVRALTEALVSSGEGMSATLDVTASSLSATVDAASFAYASEMLGVTPDATGALVAGPVTVRPAPPRPNAVRPSV